MWLCVAEFVFCMYFLFDDTELLPCDLLLRMIKSVLEDGSWGLTTERACIREFDKTLVSVADV